MIENSIIELKNIYFINNNIIILNNISLDLVKNETNIFVGPNGSGKTTILKIMYGLIKQSRGIVKRNFSKNSCFIFQNPTFLNRTVYDNLFHTLYCKNIVKTKRYDIIHNISELYEFNHLLYKNIYELSGGEMQLLSLMRALIFNPDIIFYDEPSNNLDAYHFDFIVDIIKDLSAKNKSIFLVSHDERLLKKISGNTVYLKNGCLA
tara:strand:- start:12 stop:629 length:618 start_codon:yes stop_codon:yes gene_type:complete